MITAVDTSALLSIFKAEDEAEKWLSILVSRAALGQLVICNVVAAELSSIAGDAAGLEIALAKLQIKLLPSTWPTCHLAGHVFNNYRKRGGKREHLVPDFLIAAHATLQADALVTADRGYLRAFFPRLKLLGLA